MANSAHESVKLFEMHDEQLAWQGRPVLSGLNLSIRQGEKIALIGPSGVGKSTLLKALYQQAPDKVAYCDQSPGLVPSLSAFHNIYMGCLDKHSFMHNVLNLFFPFKQAKKQVGQVAQTLGLQHKLSCSAQALSGGQQQRVALARSLIQQKPVFIGDEPVSAVDEKQAEHLLAHICASHSTVILALHNTAHAVKYCQRVIGLKDGKIVLDEVVDKLSEFELRRLYSQYGDQTEHRNREDGTRPSSPELKICR